MRVSECPIRDLTLTMALHKVLPLSGPFTEDRHQDITVDYKEADCDYAKDFVSLA